MSKIDQVLGLVDGLPAQLAERDEEFIRELVRGVKYMRQVFPIQPPASSATVPGPSQGFAWDLKLCGVQLSGSDSVAVFVGDTLAPTPTRLIGYASAPGAAPAQNVAVITWAARQVVLNAGESLLIRTSGAFNITEVHTAAVQVPAEMLGKLLV